MVGEERASNLLKIPEQFSHESKIQTTFSLLSNQSFPAMPCYLCFPEEMETMLKKQETIPRSQKGPRVSGYRDAQFYEQIGSPLEKSFFKWIVIFIFHIDHA